jgi:hypothetical protein
VPPSIHRWKASTCACGQAPLGITSRAALRDALGDVIGTDSAAGLAAVTRAVASD